MKQKVHNDEPSEQDSLNREKYAKAFANLTLNCETPMVVGLYGSWGTGKSTLMKLIQGSLDQTKTIPIWFDPWQHQFDDNPTLALVHTIIEQCNLKDSKKLATVIASALGYSFLKTVSNISVKDIEHFAKKYEEDNFLLREERVKLKDYFAELITNIVKGTDKRVVFFIDDLDRCMPEQVMKLLESLKLFLNLPNCVYFLAVDHDAIEQSIEYYYKSIDIRERNYLDKIVQLPFNIPPVFNDSINDYITPLLPNDLIGCRDILIEGLSGNPRELKRFINTLIFNHELSKESRIEEYDPKVLSVILLIQSSEKDLYKIVSNNPSTLIEYINREEGVSHGFDQILTEKDKIKRILASLKIPDERILGQYLYQTRLLSTESDIGNVQLESVLSRHRLWLESNGDNGEIANVSAISIVNTNLTNINFSHAIFEWSVLTGTDFSYSNLSSVNFRNVDASSCKFKKVDVVNADFENCKFKSASINSCKFSNSVFSGSNFSDSQLNDTVFLDCDFRNTKFVDAKMKECELKNSSFVGANFNSMNFDEAHLDSCNFSRANFSNSKLCAKDLSDTNFSHAILFNCDLSRSNLSGADFSHSNLSEANLTGCDMSGTVLFGTDVRNVKGLTIEMIESALHDESTLFDPYIRDKLVHENW
ncbi:P-loop NTPase fold protein [Pseudoalteromonas sp. R3]|uniref:P-loop NTPase fold protein n=1 Tax=Pseudoalteromonas sp. R3 TaxID=1709477 RepID=UPI0006B57DFD|nr:P-loop NTPase fold protein [Pseudoalteromonas sp. R3]AZZ98502.1 hypothetical protein ELR70_16130 [Pseudoalteromonas sp. R3]